MRLLVALMCSLVCTQAVYAASSFTPNSKCSIATSAVDKDDAKAAQAIAIFMVLGMAVLDQKAGDAGKTRLGIGEEDQKDLNRAAVADAFGYCRDHPLSSLTDAITATYQDVRSSLAPK